MEGFYICVEDGSVFQSKDKIIWRHIEGSVFVLKEKSLLIIITYQHGLYKMTNNLQTHFSHNGTFWIEM
jgi:hypothetical protein